MLKSADIKRYLATRFDLVGICPAVTPAGLSHFHDWLDAGYAGEMEYLPQRREAYAHPRHVLEGVRSIIMLGSKYATEDRHSTAADRAAGGLIARYARSSVDYHEVVHRKLKAAKKHFLELEPTALFRGVVDTAPLLEREFAQLAGIGWQGKNTMLLSKTDGSWFFLSAMLTDLDLEYDEPFEADHCGTCTACLDACPTDAFVEPRVLDARQCLSYWNIESQTLPPPEIREKMSHWLFGCDICQVVCPWNRKPTAYIDPQKATDFFPGEFPGPIPENELIEWLRLNDDEFRARFRKTPLWRSKRRGILRNCLIVLGNLANPRWVSEIAHCLNDGEPMVRAAAAWALGEIGSPESQQTLEKACGTETERWVIEEIKLSLSKNS